MNNAVYNYYVRKNFDHTDDAGAAKPTASQATSAEDGDIEVKKTSWRERSQQRKEARAERRNERKVARAARRKEREDAYASEHYGMGKGEEPRGSVFHVILSAARKGRRSNEWKSLVNNFSTRLSFMYAVIQAMYANGARYKDLVDFRNDAQDVLKITQNKNGELKRIYNHNAQDLFTVFTSWKPIKYNYKDHFGVGRLTSVVDDVNQFKEQKNFIDELRAGEYFGYCWSKLLESFIQIVPMKITMNESQTFMDEIFWVRSLDKARAPFRNVVRLTSDIAAELHDFMVNPKKENAEQVATSVEQNGKMIEALIAALYRIAELDYDDVDKSQLTNSLNVVIDNVRRLGKKESTTNTNNMTCPETTKTATGDPKQQLAGDKAEKKLEDQAPAASPAASAPAVQGTASGSSSSSSSSSAAPKIETPAHTPKVETAPKAESTDDWKKSCAELAECTCAVVISLSNGDQPGAGQLLGDKDKSQRISLEKISNDPKAVAEQMKKAGLGNGGDEKKADSKIINGIKNFFKVLGDIPQEQVREQAKSWDTIFQPLLPHIWKLAFWKNKKAGNNAGDSIKADAKKYKDNASTQATNDVKKLGEVAEGIKEQKKPAKKVVKKAIPPKGNSETPLGVKGGSGETPSNDELNKFKDIKGNANTEVNIKSLQQLTSCVELQQFAANLVAGLAEASKTLIKGAGGRHPNDVWGVLSENDNYKDRVDESITELEDILSKNTDDKLTFKDLGKDWLVQRDNYRDHIVRGNTMVPVTEQDVKPGEEGAFGSGNRINNCRFVKNGSEKDTTSLNNMYQSWTNNLAVAIGSSAAFYGSSQNRNLEAGSILKALKSCIKALGTAKTKQFARCNPKFNTLVKLFGNKYIR